MGPTRRAPTNVRTKLEKAYPVERASPHVSEKKMAIDRGYFALRLPTSLTIRLILRGAMTCSL